MTESRSSLTRRAALRVITAGGALVVATAVPGCSANQRGQTAAQPGTPAAPGQLVMIIRHGEKPDKSTSLPGIDANGEEDDSSLTETGWNRARALATVFDPQGPTRPGLVRPALIYAAGANSDGEGTRTRETVTPLAQRLGISVNTDFGKGDEKELVAQVTAQPAPTLICWQHGELPTIAEAFNSVTPTPPDNWPDDRYDVIWTMTRTADGWSFAQIPEMVLPGDQPQVISG